MIKKTLGRMKKKKMCYKRTVNKTLELPRTKSSSSIKARTYDIDYTNSKNAHSHKHLPSSKHKNTEIQNRILNFDL